MKHRHRVLLCVVALASCGSSTLAQENFTGFAELGSWFRPDANSIQVDVPEKSLRALPESLPTYSVASATPFRSRGVEWIVASCITNGLAREQIQNRLNAEPTLLIQGSTTVLVTNRISFALSPDRGEINLKFIPEDTYIRSLLTNAPGGGSLLARSEFEKLATNLFRAFDWDTADLRRKLNGDFDYLVSDTERSPRGSRQTVLIDRGVIFQRQVTGFPLIGVVTSQIEMRRLADGLWREVRIRWPKLLPTNGLRSLPRSKHELHQMLAVKKLLWDHTNPVGPGEVSKIRLKDIRLAYFQSSGLKAIEPIVFFDAELRRNDQTAAGVIVLPLAE